MHLATLLVLFAPLLLAAGFAAADSNTSALPTSDNDEPEARRRPLVLVIHGGAGTILRENMSPEREQAYREALNEALRGGYAILESGGTSLDAVEEAVRIMEESPLFNAGRGSVFTSEQRVEMDASIMDGRNRMAGAVGAVTTIRNPVRAARAVMEQTPHVMLIGDGAEQFARRQELEIVDNSFFHTEFRLQQLRSAQEREQTQLDHSDDQDARNAIATDGKFGTVGAVALDAHGNLAAATSTGGMTNKRFGRVGDSPIIGAGTFADNATCAASGTGHGEFFMRFMACYDVAARMAYKDLSVSEAAQEVVDKLAEHQGAGGIIALDREGNFTMPFNTAGMYRGYIRNGESDVAIYRD